MPPRLANSKKSTTASARVKKSKQSDDHSSLTVADDSTMMELEIKDRQSSPAKEFVTQQEDASASANVRESEEAVQMVVVEKEIEREIEVLNANYLGIEGLAGTVVEMKAKEEAIVEKNVETAIEDRMDVNTENGIEGNGVVEEEGDTVDGVENEVGHDNNDNANVWNVLQKGDNAAEKKEVDGGQDGNDGFQLGVIPVAECNSVEEETPAAQVNNHKELGGDNYNVLSVNEGEGGDSGNTEEDDKDSDEDIMLDIEDDNDPSIYIRDPFTGRKNQKDLEIFIGRLDKRAVEDDLIKVFEKFGEIKAARIVRNPTTNKSKGFAFIQYATIEQAKNALSVLKDGIEVRGKHVKISASKDNHTLCMGNICKKWKKKHVLGTLRRYGVEHIEEIHLPDDPKNEGKIKGFALLEFSTHSDAMTAFQRLRKPDAVFGRDRSAKVAFVQTPMHPNAGVMPEVKTIFVEGLTDEWNEDNVKEFFKQYGEIMRVKLSRSLGTKRKDFGFITFTSQESALACMEGINDAYTGEEVKVKVKASIAKSQYKGRLQKQCFHGGFKVKKKRKVVSSKNESESTKQAGSSKSKGHIKSKWAKRKGKEVAEEKGKTLSESKIVEGGNPDESEYIIEGQIVGTPSKLESINRKRKKLPLKVARHEKGGVENGYSKRPSKKARGKSWRRQNNNFRDLKRDPHISEGPHYGADSATYRNPYAPGYAAPTSSYHGHTYNAISGAKRPYTDLEPHAGYLEPVPGKQGPSYSGYLEPVVGIEAQPHAGYLNPAVGAQGLPHAGYLQPSVGTQGQPQSGYLEHTVGTHGQPYVGYLESNVQTQGQSHAGYLVPAVAAQSQSHAGYLEHAAGKHGHNPYDPGLSRVAGHNSQGSYGSAYGGGSALPLSYVPNYMSNAGYQGGSSISGYYQSNGGYLPPNAHY